MGRFSHLPTANSSLSSMSSTDRRRSGSSYGFPKKCFCGLDPVMRTSTTPDNPGRRFFGCRNYDVMTSIWHVDGGYHIMKWWDEAMTEEFNDVKLYVDQHGQLIDGMFISNAQSGKYLSTLLDDGKVMKAEIGQLNERLTEKQWGQIMRGVELKSLTFTGAIIIVLIMFICVCFL